MTKPQLKHLNELRRKTFLTQVEAYQYARLIEIFRRHSVKAKERAKYGA